MSKASSEYRSREQLLALSRDELVNLILDQPPERVSSWVFSDERANPPEEDPQRSEAFYRRIAENFPNGAVAVLDRSLTYVYVTGQEMQRFGLTEADFVGKPIGIVTAVEEVQRIREELQAVFRGEPSRMETTIGKETYLISAIPFTVSNGHVEQILVVSQNITERQAALRQAQESEAQFRALAENIPGVVYISTNDTARDMVYISQKIEGLCGYTAKDFCSGKVSSRMIMHPEDRDQAKQALKEAVQQQKPYHFTYRWKHREGHDCWIEEYGINIIKDQRQYFQGVLFDVSDKKHYEQELRQQNDDLKKANAELDHFAYSVSHDLRAPLTSALGLLHLLKQETVPAQRDHYNEIIRQSLLRLDNFIQEVIHLTKNARTSLEVDTVDLEEIITEVVASQKYNADFEAVDIQVDIHQNQTFRTDLGRFWIVLNNLVSNAIRYHFPFRDHPYVRITATVDTQQAVITVADNGIGIEPEHLDRIFDMFYRATDRKSGSGLGLYLVKETVTRLGGEVEVQSEYGQGTIFTVRLPSLK